MGVGPTILKRDARPLRKAERGLLCAAIPGSLGAWHGNFDGKLATRTRSDHTGRRWPVCPGHAAEPHVWAGER